ncbi:MAG: HEAT repeat domain-containing protein [Acidobacteriota bacterium]
MDHQEFQEMIVLRLYGELSSEDEARLDAHLLSCASCREEAADCSKLFRALEEYGPIVPADDLVDARERLLLRLPRTRTRRSAAGNRESGRLISWLTSGYTFARAGAAAGLLCVGFFLGYLLFSSGQTGTGLPGLLDPFRSKDLSISSVRFEQQDPESRSVVLSFKVAREVRLEGDLDDPRIQRILAYSLISEDNAGVRLRAVNAIGTEGKPDGETVAALIAAMKTDPNPAVRNQALIALRRYPLSTDIKRAFADVLLQDKNARLRIEAIDALQSAAGEGAKFDSDLIQQLGRRLADDENSYVRRKAKSFLSEVGYSAN